jgi:spore germination protein GerM
VTRISLTLAVAAALALVGQANAGHDALGSEVWFLRDGQPAAVHRTAPGMPGIVRSLLTGPTRRERSDGLRTAIPPGTALRDLTIARRVVTVDLDARFTAVRDGA